MKIVVTAGEVNDKGNWEAFCELKSIGYWAMNEGQLESSEEFTLTFEEAKKIGLRYAIRNELGDD